MLLALVAAGAAPATRPSVMEYQNWGMMHQGDPQRGRKLFLDEQRLAWRRGYEGRVRIDSGGSIVAPRTAGIGAGPSPPNVSAKSADQTIADPARG